jgi:transposase
MPHLLPETLPQGKPDPRLIEQVRDTLRLKHYSIRTERAYCDWIVRYIRYHRKRPLAKKAPSGELDGKQVVSR